MRTENNNHYCFFTTKEENVPKKVSNNSKRKKRGRIKNELSITAFYFIISENDSYRKEQ